MSILRHVTMGCAVGILACATLSVARATTPVASTTTNIVAALQHATRGSLCYNFGLAEMASTRKVSISIGKRDFVISAKVLAQIASERPPAPGSYLVGQD